MINEKYYQDIKQFPSQFKQGFDLAKDIKVTGKFNRLVICGVGGSSYYVDMLVNFLESKEVSIRIESNRGYDIPFDSDKKTLFIVASYSGNTEETLSCLEQIQENNFKYICVTAGGELLEIAKEKKVPYFIIPKGLQPRLSTGFFMAGILKILSNSKLIPDFEEEIGEIVTRMDDNLDESRAQEIAEKLIDMVPIIYATKNNWSIARIGKIKFNENSKVQAFWNYFPELNHNEMVGYTKLVMSPFFLIFKSKFTHPRNHQRIDIFEDIMTEKNLSVEVIKMIGESSFEEMINAYYLFDHITYYLAEEYGFDPEPVDMVENFKKLLG